MCLGGGGERGHWTQLVHGLFLIGCADAAGSQLHCHGQCAFVIVLCVSCITVVVRTESRPVTVALSTTKVMTSSGRLLNLWLAILKMFAFCVPNDQSSAAVPQLNSYILQLIQRDRAEGTWYAYHPVGGAITVLLPQQSAAAAEEKSVAEDGLIVSAAAAVGPTKSDALKF